MSEVSGSIPVSGLCFLLIFVVYNLSRHVRGLGVDSRVRTLFSIDLCCIYLVFIMLRFKGSTLSRHVRGLGFDSRVCFLAHVQLRVVLRPRCKGSTLSRHVRGLGFDSRVRTLFSIDVCCLYLVFTMLFNFVKRMYS